MTISIPGASTPVRPGKIVCIGRNYAAHAAEMKSEVPKKPMLFLKPSTALVRHGGTVLIPRVSEEVHFEVELVVAIGAGGKNIGEEKAMNHVAGYAVGIDMTARDIQSKAKEKGHPWSVAKGFDTFAPLGEFVPAAAVRHPHDLAISLRVNGDVRQNGTTADMIFSIPELIAYISTIFTLEEGDLIYTGTPEGVGPVEDGDTMEAEVEGLPPLRVAVAKSSA